MTRRTCRGCSASTPRRAPGPSAGRSHPPQEFPASQQEYHVDRPAGRPSSYPPPMSRLDTRRGRLVVLTTLTLVWNVALGILIASADITYLYDELNRLVRVIRDDGEAATYHYDSVGNILRITRESAVPQTTTAGSVSASSARRVSTTTVTVSGSNLAGASVTTSVSGVTIQNVRADVDSLTFDLVVSADAPLGPTTLTIAGALGTATVTLTINPLPPVVSGFSPAFGPAGATLPLLG